MDPPTERNLYEEVRGPMGIAFIMFLFADIRELAKQEELKGSPELIQKLKELPIDGYDFLTLYKENREAIQNKIDSKDQYELYASILSIPVGSDEDTVREHLRSIELIHYDDHNSEKDLVYGIFINHVIKRVTVSFRGSVTAKDFVQDAKALFSPIPNPVHVTEDALKAMDDRLLCRPVSKNVMVHLGFREYLYGLTKPFYIPDFIKKMNKATFKQFENVASECGSAIQKVTETMKETSKTTAAFVKQASDGLLPRFLKGTEADQTDTATGDKESELVKETTVEEKEPESQQDRDIEKELEAEQLVDGQPHPKQKYEVILDIVAALFKDNCGYVLQVCGHSLGGALATMFAFEAAAASDDLVPKPVTCVTTGAPKVGNLDFLHAFELLEEQGKLRYIRVANFRDIVTLSPPSYDCISAACCQNRRFRHVGLRLKLYPHGYIISYPPKMYTWVGIFCCDIRKIVKHILYLVLVCPIVVFCKNFYTYRVFRSEHTQSVYMNRFDACQEVLEDMSLDNLMTEKTAKAKWRVPVLHGHSQAFKQKENKKKAYMSFNAILEV